jgi:hypothetical protein
MHSVSRWIENGTKVSFVNGGVPTMRSLIYPILDFLPLLPVFDACPVLTVLFRIHFGRLTDLKRK